MSFLACRNSGCARCVGLLGASEREMALLCTVAVGKKDFDLCMFQVGQGKLWSQHAGLWA